LSNSTYREMDLNLLGQVKPTYLRQFVKSLGWTRVDTNGVVAFKDIAVFRKADEELLVPQRTEFVDYARRIGDLVSQLSTVEGRKQNEILNDILLPPSDILRFRLDSPVSKNGTVPLFEGFGLISGSKKALLASAHQVLSPQRFHPRMKRSEAEAFLNTCRLGQTERGSFIATFICPLQDGIDDEATTTNGPEPFTRKVTVGLYNAVAKIISAIDMDDIEPLRKQTDGSALVSANLCEALLEIQPEGSPSTLEIMATWSPTLPIPAVPASSLKVRTDYIQRISEIAKELRPKVDSKEMPIIAKVDVLQGSQGEDGRMQGEIVIVFIHDDDQPLKAKLELSADEYAVACDAHKDGRHVQMVGTLHRGSRINWVRDHKDFKLFSP